MTIFGGSSRVIRTRVVNIAPTGWRPFYARISAYGFRRHDVIDYCRNCNGPIFNQSKNARSARGHNVDGTERQRHVHCPQSGRAR